AMRLADQASSRQRVLSLCLPVPYFAGSFLSGRANDARQHSHCVSDLVCEMVQADWYWNHNVVLSVAVTSIGWPAEPIGADVQRERFIHSKERQFNGSRSIKTFEQRTQ